TWHPSLGCSSFATRPTESDSWAGMCAGSDPLGPPSTTCGEAFAPDENAPRVAIVSPEEGAVIDPVPPSVTIEVRAQDDDEVAAVRLFVDDEQVDQKASQPGTFTGAFGKGTYTLRAEAEDRSGNLAESDDHELYVGEEPGC